MIVSAAESYLRLIGYFAAAYVVAAVAMSPFAGNLPEIFAFGAWVWALPALIAVFSRNKATVADRYKWSAACLFAIIALAWIVGLTFQMTY